LWRVSDRVFFTRIVLRLRARTFSPARSKGRVRVRRIRRATRNSLMNFKPVPRKWLNW
jgi:hypothetical protein